MAARMCEKSPSVHEQFVARCNERRQMIESVCVPKILGMIEEFASMGGLGEIVVDAITSSHPSECPDLQYAMRRFKERCPKILCFPPVDIGGITSLEDAVKEIIDRIRRERELRDWFADSDPCYYAMAYEVFDEKRIVKKLHYPAVTFDERRISVSVDGVEFRFPLMVMLLRFLCSCLVDVYDSREEGRAPGFGSVTEMTWDQLHDRNVLVLGEPRETDLERYFDEFIVHLEKTSRQIFQQRKKEAAERKRIADEVERSREIDREDDEDAYERGNRCTCGSYRRLCDCD
ncbi:MAG: hypothetical protein Harvfovirus2_16 [Harvfovirus sp.]|uniref:Uncharacterized protein n=1 Tax=Harvfovirus sp. TaxID=2487768 RepID=A0A3G4ZZT3_9VIRU|nr:MAG: hypothetical protein Harvfovirus2_16 [Harvfovirus sp.]